MRSPLRGPLIASHSRLNPASHLWAATYEGCPSLRSLCMIPLPSGVGTFCTTLKRLLVSALTISILRGFIMSVTFRSSLVATLCRHLLLLYNTCKLLCTHIFKDFCCVLKFDYVYVISQVVRHLHAYFLFCSFLLLTAT